MTNLLMKTCYTSLAIMEMQIQITMKYHNIPIIMAKKKKKTDNMNCWQGCEATGTLGFNN